MKLISEEELAQLIIDSWTLACLEEAGVDNWVGYDEAFDVEMSDTAEKLKRLERLSNEEITSDYETFE